jgi:hypothetical protein
MRLFLVKKVKIEKCAYMTPIHSLLTPGYERGLVQKFWNFARLKSLICLLWGPLSLKLKESPSGG